MRRKLRKAMSKWASVVLAAALLLAARGMPVSAGTESSGAAGSAGQGNPPYALT